MSFEMMVIQLSAGPNAYASWTAKAQDFEIITEPDPEKRQRIVAFVIRGVDTPVWCSLARMPGYKGMAFVHQDAVRAVYLQYRVVDDPDNFRKRRVWSLVGDKEVWETWAEMNGYETNPDRMVPTVV